MYGNLLLDEFGKLQKGERISLGVDKGRDETWLRDTLFDNPEIIPIDDLDPTFGPLIPLCKELRTEVGSIDAVFVNSRGRLTIVECKLWKNPQARREVVAQALHYVSDMNGWSYADLESRVRKRGGNLPYELVRKHGGADIKEQSFVDAVSRSLREGRILVLIAGDGIREDVQSLTDLVNRKATMGFSFGLIEVALYQFGKNCVAIQPRLLAKPEVIVRHVTIVNMKEGNGPVVVEDASDKSGRVGRQAKSGNKDHLKEWWQPVLDMKFDDPEQEAPFWTGANNAVLNTPFQGIQIKAFAIVNGSQIGVFVSGPRLANLTAIQKHVKRERRSLLQELPDGTEIRSGNRWPIAIYEFNLESDDEKRAWIMRMMNAFATILRPRLRKWYEETQR